MSGGDSSAEGAGDRSGRVVALEGDQGYRALVRSRGTITDSPEHRPHRCLPAAGVTITTAQTAAMGVMLFARGWPHHTLGRGRGCVRDLHGDGLLLYG